MAKKIPQGLSREQRKQIVIDCAKKEERERILKAIDDILIVHGGDDKGLQLEKFVIRYKEEIKEAILQPEGGRK